MRREKTMKICANFYLKPSIALKENAGSDRSWVWQCADFSEEKTELSVLAIRFANSESALRSCPPLLPLLDCDAPRSATRAPPPALTRVPPTRCAASDALKFKEEFESGQKAMAAVSGSAPTPEKPAAEAAPASEGDKEAPTEAKAEA